MMDKKVVLLLCTFLSFASCSVSSNSESQQPRALTNYQCKVLCAALTTRFKNNDVFTTTKANSEFETICNEDSIQSREMCMHFRDYGYRIAQLSEDISTRKICNTFCEEITEKTSNSTNTTQPSISRCDQCKSKVKIASNIAGILQVSLGKVIDIICPSLQIKNLKFWVMCKKAVKNIAASSSSIDKVENRICSALNLCESSKPLPNSCALESTPRRSSVLEISFKIFNIIAQVARPHLARHHPKLGQSFDIIDETAKCLSAKQSTGTERSARRNRKTDQCHRSCSSVSETVRNQLASEVQKLTVARRHFDQYCSTLTTTFNKCRVIHEATDGRMILEALFQKQTCELFRCDLLEMYPNWRCKLCEFNSMQTQNRIALSNAMKTVTEIENSIRMLCKKNKDHRCDDFLAEHRRFLQSLNDLLKKNSICKVIGFCKK